MPPLAAATPVPFPGSPAVHADVTCNPEPVQAAPPMNSASSQPPVLPGTQQLLLASEVAGTLAAAAEEAEEVAMMPAVAASSSDPKAAAQGVEEAASTTAEAGWLDAGASLQQPEPVAQPDTVMSEVLPATAAAVFATLEEDLQLLSPHAVLQPQAPVIESSSMTATTAADPKSLDPTVAAPHPETQAESDMVRLDLQPPAADARGADTAAGEATSIGLEAPQQGSAAEVASCVQQAASDMSTLTAPDMCASLAGGDAEPVLPVPMLDPASAPDGLEQALWRDTTAAATGPLQVSMNDDHGATKAPPPDAQRDLAMSEITGQPLCSSESASAGVLNELFSPADIVSAGPIQPVELSLSTAPVSIAAGAHEPARQNDTDAALSAQQTGEAKGTGACIPDLLLSCTSSDFQDHDSCTLSEHNQVPCTSVPSLAFASLKGDGEGTVVMLEGNSLLDLAGYYESDPDSSS